MSLKSHNNKRMRIEDEEMLAFLMCGLIYYSEPKKKN